MKKPINKISDNMVIEALQIIHNYCKQESSNCAECMLHMKDTTCIFFAELPKRFDACTYENNIQIVGEKTKGKRK